MKYEEITNEIIKAFFKVYNTLGYGFLEKVYENAMYVEWHQQDLKWTGRKECRCIIRV